jgi:hypothetical protein
VQPGQPQGGSPFGETPEPTQVVQPTRPGEGGAGATQALPPVDANATQMVNPGGDAPVAESTQLVPPGSQPPPSIPYTPPPSAADNPAAAFGQQQGGYGQPGGYGQQQPGGFGQPGQPGQPPQGFGGPPGFGGPQQQQFGGPPQQQFGAPSAAGGNPLFGYIAGGVVALLGLLSLIFAFVYFGDASDYSKALSGAPSGDVLDKFLSDAGVVGSGTLWFYVIMLLVFSLVALVAGAGLALAGKLPASLKKLLPIAVVAGGALITLFGVLMMLGTTPNADYLKQFGANVGSATGIGVAPMIFGILILIIGVLGLIPATAQFVGLGAGGAAPAGPPQGFGGPPSGFGGPQQPGFGQPQQQPGFGHQPGQPGPPPQGFGQPPQGYGPPPGYGQPGGPNPASGGFPQPSSGGFPQQPQQPQQPGGFGQPGQPPHGYPQQPGQQPGQPPQGWGQPPQQQGPPSGGFGQPGQPPQQW